MQKLVKQESFEEANFARMQGSLARQQGRSAELGYYGQAGMSLLTGFGENNAKNSYIYSSR
jgi:hypothetical protein